MKKNYNVVNIVPKKSIFEGEIRDTSSLNNFVNSLVLSASMTGIQEDIRDLLAF